MIERLTQRPGSIDGIAFLRDGTPVTAGRDGPLVAHGSAPRILAETEGSFACVVDGVALVAASTIGELVWLHAATGEEIRRTSPFDEGVGCLAQDPNGLVAAGGDSSTLSLFDADGSRRWVAETYKWPYALAFEGPVLHVATWDAYVYSVPLDPLPPGSVDAPYALPYPANGPAAPMPYFALVVHEGRAVLGHERGALLFTPTSGATLAEVEVDAIHALALCPKRRVVAGGGQGACVYTWRLDDLHEHARHLLASDAAVTPASSYVPAYAEFHAVSGPAAVTALAFGPDDRLYIGTAGGELWALES